MFACCHEVAESNTGADAGGNRPAVIRIRGLEVALGGRTVLDGLDLDILPDPNIGPFDGHGTAGDRLQAVVQLT